MQHTDGVLFVLMLVMLMAGACNVLLKDFMVNLQVPISPGGPVDNFQQPIMWSLLMKMGMALCLPFHCARPQAPMYVFAISCGLGFATDVFVNMAYCAIAGSAIQMLRGGKVVLTALLSIALLKRRLKLYQIAGALIVVLGISLVGFSTSKPQAAAVPGLATLPWKAISFCVAGELTQSVLWIYQESVLKKYDIAPLQLVGIEGAIGVLLGGLAVAVAHPLGLENLEESAHQLRTSMPLLASVLCLLVSMAFFNFSGVGITKLGSAVHRSIIDVSRAIVIWAVELAFGWHTFAISQFCGFAVLAFGALLYNHVLVVPTLEGESLEDLPLLAKREKKDMAALAA
eukprot:TRINITY_DN45899_c0_g1_i1.p1 TRINITY_DN45899_c0_g1~~TRINITY_DN45899_c0_g1_i1.p1  ORF type:complete len:343 (-),score=68.87 TRINITY_DN45899_c0_g1_i1:169-1197(-)